MRLEELTVVEIRRVSQDQVAIAKKKITLNLDAVCGIAPDTVPSEITGPTGEPVGIPACVVIVPGAQFLVEKTYQEMKALLQGVKLIEDD
jgi:hypothetical protein